jgi:DNA end-binding protein Ku
MGGELFSLVSIEHQPFGRSAIGNVLDDGGCGLDARSIVWPWCFTERISIRSVALSSRIRSNTMPAASRAAWKGFLRVGSVPCVVRIGGEATEAEKIRFNVPNRKTGNRVRSIYVDDQGQEGQGGLGEVR